jgi:hypothetical protein
MARERTRRQVKKMARQRRVRDLPVLHETEAQKVYIWRLRELERAGMPRQFAKRVADSDYDLHRCLDMLAAGCSPELLIDIVL